MPPAFLMLLSWCAMSMAEVRFDAIQSTRGIQHSKVQPILSDDFVVACIMIMFLLLFCFGKQ
jgi:hypothetical protein